MKRNVFLQRAFLSVGLSGSFLKMTSSPGNRKAATDEDRSWREVNGVIYGAKPDHRGEIGGGSGYTEMITKGDHQVKDLTGLVKALEVAKAGEVIFIPAETEIDLTTHIYIEKLVLDIPAGVTLAGNRGQGGSKGAILTSDALDTPVMIRALGPGVRITGLRIQGPNPKRYLEHHRKSFGPGGEGHKYYYKFPISNAIETRSDRLRVDNCEISAFSSAAIYLHEGSGHHIHHNYIHHCQYNGLGYGVCIDKSDPLIEYNLFDYNRHSIAGTGISGSGYIARHNIELGVSLSHCFDMHGGRDRKDGTDIAGKTIEIYNNTFSVPYRVVVIRGVPEDKCVVYKNRILKHNSAETAVRAEEKTSAYDNLYGEGQGVVK